MEIKEQAEPVQAGDAVFVVDEQYGEHIGLVTVVHGQFGAGYVPCINVVYVTSDPAKRDPYGQQVERMSSLQHYSAGPTGCRGLAGTGPTCNPSTLTPVHAAEVWNADGPALH